jgi:hypothetical protein
MADEVVNGILYLDEKRPVIMTLCLSALRFAGIGVGLLQKILNSYEHMHNLRVLHARLTARFGEVSTVSRASKRSFLFLAQPSTDAMHSKTDCVREKCPSFSFSVKPRSLNKILGTRHHISAHVSNVIE